MIRSFKLFESLSIGMIERGEYVSVLTESERMDEGLWSSIKNYFSKMLGGSVDKLDKNLNKYKDNELEYWTNWADARSRYNKAEALYRESKDPVDKMKYEEQRERVKKLMSQVDSSRRDISAAVQKQAQNIIKDSQRLKDYYDLKKAKIDEEVARESYEIVKRSTEDDTIVDLFDANIKKAVDVVRTKNAAFQKKYGDQFMTAPDSGNDGELKIAGMHIEDLINKSLSDIHDKLKAMHADSLHDIIKYLEKEAKRTKDKREDQIKHVKNTVSDKEQQSKEIEEITRKAGAKLEELDKKVNAIEQLVLAAKNVTKEIKKNPEIVTNKTEDELGPRNTNTAIHTAISQTAAKTGTKPDAEKVEQVISASVKNNFAEAKHIIEEEIGEEIDQTHFNHIINDLVALYGKLTFYYKDLQRNVSSKTLEIGLIDFAAELYKHKKKNNILAGDLSQKELDKMYDKYEK